MIPGILRVSKYTGWNWCRIDVTGALFAVREGAVAGQLFSSERNKDVLRI